MRFPAFACLAVLGFCALRCDDGASDADDLGGAAGATGSGGATGGSATGGNAGDCEAQSCCLAKESYCQGDEIWWRPLDDACTEAPEFGEVCESGCAVSTLYQFAYCEGAANGGAGGEGGLGGLGGG